MEAAFWHQKWSNNEIAFHGQEANPLLLKFLGELSLSDGARVFVPLCGKTLDIHWLLASGHRVAGAELSQTAVEQLFAELGIRPEICSHGNLKQYSAENLDIFVGDIFQLSSQMLGKVDAVYDRAALVALPEEMRTRYAAHLTRITNSAPQLLICFEYNQSLMPGPPFSIAGTEVSRLYADHYSLTQIEDVEISGGLKGKPAREVVYLLKALALPRNS